MMENIGLTEKTEKPNRTESIRFGSVIKSNRFGSVLQKLAKTEPNRPMLTPIGHADVYHLRPPILGVAVEASPRLSSPLSKRRVEMEFGFPVGAQLRIRIPKKTAWL